LEFSTFIFYFKSIAFCNSALLWRFSLVAIAATKLALQFGSHRFLQLRSLVSLLPTVSSDARNYLWSAGLKGSICNGTVALSFGLMVESQAHSTKEKIGDTIIMHL